MGCSRTYLVILFSIFMLGIVVLSSRLFRLQVMNTERFTEDLSRQVTRRIQLPALRGNITDVNGIVLAECHASRTIECRVEEFQRPGPWSNTVNAVASAMYNAASIIGATPAATTNSIAHHVRQSLALPLTLFKDLTDEQLSRFAEHSRRWPGFFSSVTPQRFYPCGSLAAHTIGYVGRDRPENTAQKTYHAYKPELTGRAGIEQSYNRFLTGVAGEETVHVDARGFIPNRSKRQHLATPSKQYQPPSPGIDLRLTLDVTLQRIVERELEGLLGACVILDPNDGAVLAIASSPTYDLNTFVPTLAKDVYQELLQDEAKPLFNRATSGCYAPGSIFKPITALAALRTSAFNPLQTFHCTGIYMQTRCFDRYGHGDITLNDAIEHSCNAYFMHAALTAGSSNILAMAQSFGLGEKTGIDLPSESAGNLEPWRAQSAIGQGNILVTPLQMAAYCAALANGGRLYRPYLHARMKDQPPPEPVHTLNSPPENIETIRSAMRAVVMTGSGRKVMYRYPPPNAAWHRRVPLATTCAAKTGTAEVGTKQNRHKNTWVIAFAPYENPRYAIAMVIENGESGGVTAAPKVHNILASIFGEVEG